MACSLGCYIDPDRLVLSEGTDDCYGALLSPVRSGPNRHYTLSKRYLGDTADEEALRSESIYCFSHAQAIGLCSTSTVRIGVYVLVVLPFKQRSTHTPIVASTQRCVIRGHEVVVVLTHPGLGW